MSKQLQDAYIVAAARLPIGRRNGYYKTTRPDDMLSPRPQDHPGPGAGA